MRQLKLLKTRTSGLLVVATALFLIPNFAFAQSTTTCSQGQGNGYTISLPFSSTTYYCNFTDYFVGLVGWAIGIAQVLAVLMVLWGAFKYTTSGGDQAKIKDAKDIIIGALVGFALLLLIRVIIPIIGV